MFYFCCHSSVERPLSITHLASYAIQKQEIENKTEMVLLKILFQTEIVVLLYSSGRRFQFRAVVVLSKDILKDVFYEQSFFYVSNLVSTKG